MYELAKSLFLQGKSLRAIEEETGFDRKKLSQQLKREGIAIKTRGLTKGTKKYNHNTRAFKIIDTEEKAYWLGFLYADGSIYEPRGTLELSLKHDDKYHLEKFRDFISPEIEVKDKPIKLNGQIYMSSRIQVVCMEIVHDLIALGCPPAKSLILKFPASDIVPYHLIHHFMRGYYDGDGIKPHLIHDPRWPNSKPQVSVQILGTKEFLDAYVQHLPSFPLRENYATHGRAFGYRFGGNGLYKRFVDFLYRDATIYLERKLRPVAHLKSGELLET